MGADNFGRNVYRTAQDAFAKARAGAVPTAEAIAVTRPSGKEPYPVLVGTLWGNHLRFKLGRLDRPLAVVFVTVPAEPQEAPIQPILRAALWINFPKECPVPRSAIFWIVSATQVQELR